MTGVSGWPHHEDPLPTSVSPDHEGRWAESSMFSSPGRIPAISSLHDPKHLQTGALNTNLQGINREMVLDFCWDSSYAVVMIDFGFPQQVHCNKRK